LEAVFRPNPDASATATAVLPPRPSTVAVAPATTRRSTSFGCGNTIAKNPASSSRDTSIREDNTASTPLPRILGPGVVCHTKRIGIFHGVTEIDDFLAGLEPADRDLFRHICELVVGVVPEAQPGKSYGMAAYRAAGKPLLGFTSNKGHLAMHPFSPAVVEAVSGDLTGFSLSKGTIRFSTDRPVPDEVVERIVLLRMAEIRP
jgi:uncharacterized protein YdhG (YjbR/CyaY superfamily)